MTVTTPTPPARILEPPRRRSKPVWEWLFAAVLLAVLVYWSQAYDPTRPSGTRRLELTVGFYSAVYLFLTFFTPPQVNSTQKAAVRLKWLAMIAFWYQLFWALNFMILSGGGLLYVMNNALGFIVAGVELAILAAVVMAWRKGRLGLHPFRFILVLGIFLNAMLNVGLCAWMWRPLPAAVCDAGNNEFVDRLSPQEWHETFSHPHTLSVVPDKQAVAVAFKASGDLTIYPWDVPTSNRAALFDISDPDAGIPMTVIQRTGGDMPLFFTWDAGRQQLIMANMGLGDGSIDFIDLADWPASEPRIVRTEDIDYATARPFYIETYDKLVVLSLYGDVFVYDAETFEEERHYRFDPDGKDLLTTGCRSVPLSTNVVASTMGFYLQQMDWMTGKVRKVDVDFNIGDMTIAPYSFRSFSGDFALRAINVVDLATMTRTHRIPVDFAPRGFAVDRHMDVLAVGDWFGGKVHLYSATTLEEIAEPIPLSPYLRAMEFDPARGDLYVTGKCGLYRIQLARYLAQAGHTYPPRPPRSP